LKFDIISYVIESFFFTFLHATVLESHYLCHVLYLGETGGECLIYFSSPRGWCFICIPRNASVQADVEPLHSREI